MSKIPYIPLYIGDWEQDMNIVSLEAEAAWLRIIFKMFKEDKTGIYKVHTKSLQNLWRKTPEQCHEIVTELKISRVCEITIEADYFIFQNRRMIKEKNLSKIRSTSVQNRYKTSTNDIQKREYEYDNEYEIKKTIEDRKLEFINSVGEKFLDQYSKELLLAFCDHWTEYNEGGKKMRCEMEKVFDIAKRLRTWSNNDKKWNHGKKKSNSSSATTEDILAAVTKSRGGAGGQKND